MEVSAISGLGAHVTRIWQPACYNLQVTGAAFAGAAFAEALVIPLWMMWMELIEQVMRRKGNLGALSGADGSRYMEYDSRPPKKHPLFKSRYIKM